MNLYAFGFNSTGLTGNVENTDVGLHIANLMGLHLDRELLPLLLRCARLTQRAVITQELNKCEASSLATTNWATDLPLS